MRIASTQDALSSAQTIEPYRSSQQSSIILVKEGIAVMQKDLRT
jgi:hypothetical protein